LSYAELNSTSNVHLEDQDPDGSSSGSSPGVDFQIVVVEFYDRDVIVG
jgi:hypothetical protein